MENMDLDSAQCLCEPFRHQDKMGPNNTIK